jgi:hypothetical protein
MKLIVLTIFSAAFVLVCAQGTSACQCRREALDTEEKFRVAVAKEFRASDAVFIGEVIEQQRSKIKFRVEQVWKGKISDNAIIITHNWDDGDVGAIDSCAYPFDVGIKYLIYARKSADELGASKCSRTQLFEKAGRDINELERSKPKDPKRASKKSARLAFDLYRGAA